MADKGNYESRKDDKNNKVRGLVGDSVGYRVYCTGDIERIIDDKNVLEDQTCFMALACIETVKGDTMKGNNNYMEKK